MTFLFGVVVGLSLMVLVLMGAAYVIRHGESDTSHGRRVL